MFKGMKLGFRGRLVLVLATSAGLGVTLLVTTFRPLLLSGTTEVRAERLLWSARLAAALAPTDSSSWEAWTEDLGSTLPGIRTFLIRTLPGEIGFAAICAEKKVTPSDATAAFLQGEALVEANEETPVAAWGALVRLSGNRGERALLGIFEKEPSLLVSKHLWNMWLLLVVMVFILVSISGYLVAYATLIRPLNKIVNEVGREFSGAPLSNDLKALRQAVIELTKKMKETSSRAERLRSELNRIREDFKGAQASLLRAEKLASVGQLAAGIAHEIGNPLGIVIGLSELLANEDTTADEVRKYAADIHAATMRVHGILKDLLAFARPAREEGAVADVSAVVDETIHLLMPQKRFKGVKVQVEKPEGVISAEIKPSQLQQILVNLLMNASDAMGGKGRIVVSIRTEDRYVLIDVIDEGPGVRPEDRERVFDPFYTTKPPGEGTGLGLAICAQIANAYGGEITVSDAPVKGACFTLRLWRVDI